MAQGRTRRVRAHTSSASEICGRGRTLTAGPFRLSDAQLVIAREYGLAHWTELKQRIEANSLAKALIAAIHADDRTGAVQLIQTSPQLLRTSRWSAVTGDRR